MFGASPHVCDNPDTMVWIDDEEKQYRERRKAKKREEDLQCDRAEAIRAQARPLLDALVEVVESDVKNYSERVKDDSERRAVFNRKPSGGFKLDRLHYPSASVDCSLDLDNEQIRAEYGFRKDGTSQTRREHVSLQLDVDESGNVEIKNPDGVVCTRYEASRLLIQHVLFGTK